MIISDSLRKSDYCDSVEMIITVFTDSGVRMITVGMRAAASAGEPLSPRVITAVNPSTYQNPRVLPLIASALYEPTGG